MITPGMKKWIDSNYHYMVPEFDKETKVNADLSEFIADVKRGIAKLGETCATPVVLGPVTIVRLVNFTTFYPGQTEALLLELLPVYKKLFEDLGALGITEVQVHEPALIFDEADLLPLYKKAYPYVFSPEGPAINIVTFLEDIGIENYKWLTSLSEVSVISLDFTRGDSILLIEKFGFPSSKTLGVGLIDGRNVWKVDHALVDDVLDRLSVNVSSIRIQPSAPLQYVPWDLSSEKAILSQTIGQVLSFAIQKVAEVALVANVAKGEATLDDHKAAWLSYRTMLTSDKSISDRVGKF